MRAWMWKAVAANRKGKANGYRLVRVDVQEVVRKPKAKS